MKRIKIIIASAMLMLSCSMALADDYTVGLKKMIEANALESVNMETIQKMTSDKSIRGKVLDKVVERAASCYRENMSVDEFKSMVEFCTNQEYVDLRNRLDAIVTKDFEADFENFLTDEYLNFITMNILAGKKCETTAKAKCSPEYDAEIETFLEISSIKNVMDGILPAITASIMMEVENQPNAKELKPQMEKAVQELCNVINKDLTTLIGNALIKNVPLEDLKKYDSITQQPFYANMKKANAALAANILT